MCSMYLRWLLFASAVLFFLVSCRTTTNLEKTEVEAPDNICAGRANPCEPSIEDPEELFENCINSISPGLAPGVRRKLEIKCERLLAE